MLLGVLALAACASDAGRVTDLEGQTIGWQQWKPVTEDQAALALAGDVSLVRKREAANLPSRYLESWTLEGGHLFYERLKDGGFAAGSDAPAFLLALYRNNTALNERGIVLDAAQIREDGPLLIAAAASDQAACAVFSVVFGEQAFPESPGDRLLRGGLCRRGDGVDPRLVEAQLRELLSRLTADGSLVLTSGA